MRRKNFFAKICSCLTAASLLPTGVGSAYAQTKYSLNEVLHLYGFASQEQQEAFKLICEKAGVNLPDAFGARELLELVDATQQNLVNRADKQERWETSDLDWMAANQKSLNEKFKNLGLVDAVLPQKKHYDVVAILGSRMAAMAERIKFVESLVTQEYKFDKVVLLTGERYATVGVDGSKEKLEEVAKYFDIKPSNVTETHLFKFLYDHSSLKDNVELVVIDTPQKDGRRPTTQTTVEDFCTWNKSHPEVQTAVFISGQPHVLYQKAIVAEVLHTNGSTLKFEVIGHESAAESTKTFAGALGSYLWANVSQVLRVSGLKVESTKEKDLVEKLYARAPWLYKKIFH